MERLAEDTWESTYDRASALVHRVARRMSLSADATEDLCHTVLERFLAGPAAVRERQSDGWLVRVAQNAARDLYRGHTRTRRLLRALPAQAILAVEDGSEYAAEHDWVCAAIARLPGRQAALIELAFFRDLTHLEIASMTGLPLGTVKTRIRGGLQRLRALLQATERRL